MLLRIACLALSALSVLSVLSVLSSSACQPTCREDKDCKLDERVCVDGACEFRTVYSCDGDTLVAAAGPDDEERFDCADFFSRCVADDDGESARCVRPNGGQACKHMLEDCGLVLVLQDGTALDEIGCAEAMRGANACAAGCLGVAPCDPQVAGDCLREPDTCADPPAPDDDVDAGPATGGGGVGGGGSR